ncbi:MAG TPA: TetR/AcrR family transcriptional regulator [Micropepsaceae bacterium]|nr:TetR/AcrR family transcriptional regulator [Micropepsaceae bacterium]
MEAQLRRPMEQRVAGKRAQSKEQNRRVILDAARRVFAELGYGATTVRDIIRATPLASGTFYNYFRSKEEVFQAMRDETALALRPLLREARLKCETAEAFVAETFRTFFAYVVENRANLPKVNRTDAVHVRVDTAEVLAGFEELRADLEAAIGRGLFAPIDAEYLTASMVGIAFELADVVQRRELPDAEAAARFATTLVMGGLAALPKQKDQTPATGPV